MGGGELLGGSDDPVTDEEGRTAAGADMGAWRMLEAADGGDVDAMRALLEHPSADPAAMLMHADSQHGFTALTLASRNGRLDAMRALLDHPSADPAAMLMHSDSDGRAALQQQAEALVAHAVRLVDVKQRL
jgi:ankyrin repeat protein